MEYLVDDIEIKKDIVLITLKDLKLNTIKYNVHAVAFANYYFRVGIKIDDEYLTNLLKESNYYILKDEVIKKLRNKDYSKFEIKELLTNKLEEKETTRLINDLENNNYLNDYNYVKNVFCDAQNKFKGRLYVENKLKGKGIDENIIDSFFEHFNEKILARKLVNIEYKKLKDKYPKNVLINKISYKLNYNGFSELIINEEISNLENLKETNNDDLLIKDYSKLLKKYQNKFKNKELERKLIESLLAKGYNYKSIKELIEGMKVND